jgi:putative Holliday junction resolvase
VARTVGLDAGERRIGIAISDPSGTLARPVSAIRVAALDSRAVRAVADALASLADPDEPIEAVVLGLPRRLDGSPNLMTPKVERFAALLQQHTGKPVHLQDERLTSREAESLLARRTRDWRARKQQLDAAAAALILQDYLDAARPVACDPDADPDILGQDPDY